MVNFSHHFRGIRIVMKNPNLYKEVQPTTGPFSRNHSPSPQRQFLESRKSLLIHDSISRGLLTKIPQINQELEIIANRFISRTAFVAKLVANTTGSPFDRVSTNIHCTPECGTTTLILECAMETPHVIFA